VWKGGLVPVDTNMESGTGVKRRMDRKREKDTGMSGRSGMAK